MWLCPDRTRALTLFYRIPRLQSTTKLPDLLAALAEEQPQISADVSLQDVLTEDEELKLSDFCWELEESMDVENEQLATRILQLLGMKR